MRKFLIANLEKGNGTITEEQVIELGGEVREDSIVQQDLPQDFFISGEYRGTPSILQYGTDIPNNTIDLTQYVPTMRTVSEILRQPGTNNIICISGNNTSFVTNPMQVLKLTDCRIINNILVPSGFEFAEFIMTNKTHGSDIDDNYIYVSTRASTTNYLTVGTEIIKININNFLDYKRLVIEPSSGIKGPCNDIIEYKESLYVALYDSIGNRDIKFVKIDKNLNKYESIITISDGNSNSGSVEMPFAIYNDEVIIFGRNKTNTQTSNNNIVINIYSLTGQLKRKKELVLGTLGTINCVPHWCTVINNKLIVTPSGGADATIDRYIFRADIGTGYDNDSIVLEEVTLSKRLVSDDNTLMSNGMLYIGNETGFSTPDSKLIRMPYWDFTQQEVLLENYCHLSALKTKISKPTNRTFDTLFYKNITDRPSLGAKNNLYVVKEGGEKGIYVWSDANTWVLLGANQTAEKIELTRPLLNTNFTTSTLIEGLPQYGKEINLQNTTNIEITVDSTCFQTYAKLGNGNIKFVADTGRTLKLMDATDTISGIVGSYAKVKSFGTVDYIYINNYE